MPSLRPAYSSIFHAENLHTIDRMAPIDNITREWAWGGSSGAGIRVAVIDSGVDAQHPAVGEVNGYVTIHEDGSTVRLDGTPHQDDFGHGTACAGIIRSFAPDCEIYSVKVLGSGLFGSGNAFIDGLQWALDNGMHVCNLSLCTTKKDFYGVLHELVDRAYFQHAMLVAAANNLPLPSFPGLYSSVLSVASHDTPDPYCYYYNPKPPVEFGAHGIDVHVAWKDGGYATLTGNSFATPHITGLVTKILAKHPYLTVFQMKSILRALANNIAPNE